MGRWNTEKGIPSPFFTIRQALRAGARKGDAIPFSLLRYAFRIRALSPNKLESPWSDEVSCMAP